MAFGLFDGGMDSPTGADDEAFGSDDTRAIVFEKSAMNDDIAGAFDGAAS